MLCMVELITALYISQLTSLPATALAFIYLPPPSFSHKHLCTSQRHLGKNSWLKQASSSYFSCNALCIINVKHLLFKLLVILSVMLSWLKQ